MNHTARVFAVGILCAIACAKAEPASNSTITVESTNAEAVPAPASAEPIKDAIHLPADRTWYEAVHLEDWSTAKDKLDALPESAMREPAMRYIRARVALAQQDWPLAIAMLEGLDLVFPQLTSDIVQYRAQAHAEGGDASIAAQHFAQSSSVRSLTKASIAFARAGDADQARMTIDRAVQAAGGKTGNDAVDARVDARRHRASLAQTGNDIPTAVADLRFVYLHARDPETAQTASATLAQIDPTHPLTSAERMDRAKSFTSSGHAESALAEIDLAVAAPGGPPSRVDQALARARALHSGRTRNREAAQAFEQAFELKGSHVPEAMYYAAQSWSRADDNDRGIALYARVVREHGRTSWAERASFFGSRLQRFERRWSVAEKGYRAYLARYPNGSFAKEANYELAVCLLLKGDHQKARSIFGKLAGKEKEAYEASGVRYLEAVAAHGEGKPAEAYAIWRNMIAAQPLSFFALASSARLAADNQQVPHVIPPAPTTPSEPLRVSLPPTVLLLRDLGLARDAEQHLRSHEDAIFKAHGERGAEALCQAYGQLPTGARHHRIGQQHASASLVRMAPGPSNRWAWNCLYPRPYHEFTGRLEQQLGIPQWLLHSIMRQESAFDPNAQSPVGAQGLMQLMPATAAKTAQRMGSDADLDSVSAPGLNISVGANYLSMLLHMFGGSVVIAAGAYNAGPVAVGRWLRDSERIPLDVWVALIPYRETRHYVWRVVGNWARYRYLAEGESGVPQLDQRIPVNIHVPDDAY